MSQDDKSRPAIVRCELYTDAGMPRVAVRYDDHGEEDRPATALEEHLLASRSADLPPVGPAAGSGDRPHPCDAPEVAPASSARSIKEVAYTDAQGNEGVRTVMVATEPQKIDQTEFGEHGNCQSACIAMMLGLPLSEVPNWSAMPISDNQKYTEQGRWLRARGWHLLTICPYQALPWPPAFGFYIAGGASPRGFRHSVMFKDGKLWHDPHPSREGIVGEVQDVDILVPLQPFAPNSASGDTDAKDAARYRWLRDVSVPPHNFYLSVPDEFKDERYKPQQVDAAIDAAIGARSEGRGANG